MANINKVRNSSVELLRIVAMVFIVMSHYCVHNGMDRNEITFGFNNALLSWGALGNLGVIIFVMITGFFMCRSKLKLQSVFRTAFATWFYSVVLFAVAMLSDSNSVSVKTAIKSFLPISSSHYWFVSAYFALLLFVPFINKLISVLTRRQFFAVNCIMVIMWAVLPTFTDKTFYSNELTAFVMYYMLGAYISIYPDAFFAKKSGCAVMAAGSLAAAMLQSAATLFGESAVPLFVRELNWYSRSSLFMIIAAVSMLAFFSKLCISNRFINTLASCTFGVYLIHENIFVRPFLWQTLFRVEDFKNSPWMLVHMIGSVAAVFLLCSAVEYVRRNIVEKPVMKLYSKAEALFKDSGIYRKISTYINNKL